MRTEDIIAFAKREAEPLPACIQRTGASGSARLQFGRQWRLAPAADVERWPET